VYVVYVVYMTGLGGVPAAREGNKNSNNGIKNLRCATATMEKRKDAAEVGQNNDFEGM